MASGSDPDPSRSTVLRFAAALSAARDFGLDQPSIDGIAVRFDPRRPNLDEITQALADALLARRPLT